MKKELKFALVLVLLTIIFNYDFLDGKVEEFFLEEDVYFIDRVIDGDTIKSGDESIRLLGINTPEKGEELYLEAKEFLESKVLNKSVKLIYGRDKQDKYGRTLAYVFVGDENVNLKLVEKGFANFYFPSGKDDFYDDFYFAWENCENNLCEESKDKCSECIILEELDFKEEKVVLRNVCDFSCDLTNWTIKDEGRKKFTFKEFVLEPESIVKIFVFEGEDNSKYLFWRNEKYVWTDSGDSLFLRDSSNNLVLWKSY